MEISCAGTYSTGMRSAKRHNSFSAEIITFQECADDLRCLPVPNRIPPKHNVILLHVLHRAGDGRTGGSISLFPDAAAVRIIIVKIRRGKELVWGDSEVDDLKFLHE